MDNSFHYKYALKSLQFFLTSLIILVLLQGCGSSGINPKEQESSEPGWHQGSLKHGELNRVFRFYIPQKMDENAAVVILLHGGTQSMDEIFKPYAGATREWKQIAEEEGLLLVVPNGTNKDGSPKGNDQNWNDCRPKEQGLTDVDDVGFIEALLEWTSDRFADNPITLDFEHVFVTGASNGGMMAYRLATELPSRFAGAAAFIANRPQPSECPKAHTPLPMLAVNGMEDPIMPYEGGEIIGGRGDIISAEATRDYWLSVNQATSADSDTTQLPDRNPNDDSVVICEEYPPSEEGAAVRFCRVEGGGHTMPSVEHRLFGRQNHDVEGARLAWEFFKNHQK